MNNIVRNDLGQKSVSYQRIMLEIVISIGEEYRSCAQSERLSINRTIPLRRSCSMSLTYNEDMDMPEIILKTIIKILAEAETEAKIEIEAGAKAEGLSEAKAKVKVFANALVLAEDEIETEIEALTNSLSKAELGAFAENLSEAEAYAKSIADAIILKAKIITKYTLL